MTTADGKTIPAYFLRAQALSAHKREREAKERARRAARRERVAQRLAAALGENTQEAFMDETHPGRIYLKPAQLEKFFDLLDKSRAGSAGQYNLFDWIGNAFPQTTEGTWRFGWDNIMHPYIEPVPTDTPEALAVRQQKLTQELAQVTAQLKGVSMDELKSKMLTLMDVGEAVTVSKPDPNAPTGPQLVKDEAPVEAASTAGG